MICIFAIVQIFSFASLSRTFHLSPHEYFCTIALLTIHNLFIIQFSWKKWVWIRIYLNISNNFNSTFHCFISLPDLCIRHLSYGHRGCDVRWCPPNPTTGRLDSGSPVSPARTQSRTSASMTSCLKTNKHDTSYGLRGPVTPRWVGK